MAKKKIQYQDKTRFDVSGDQITGKFTYADANQIKDVVNTNADLLHEHNNKLFLDKINQDLSDLASPNFKNLGVEGNVNANVVSANTEVNTANVNATNRVNTKLLNADNAVVNFHINSDTLTAETQIDTNILNAILQVNTDTVNADSAVNTDILNADSQVNTVEVRTNIARVGEQSSEAFVSGFAGLGYRLAKDSNGNYMLELDRLSVRKDFTVYELIVSQIRATNGSLWVSDATKIESVTKDGANYKCTIDTDGDTIWIPFQVDDIVRCQKFNGKNMKYYTAKVISINTTDKHFTLQVIEGANFPQAKDDIVRIGNATNTNRQGAVYLTASDNGAPFIDVIDGVTSASLAGKTKVRLGKLDGIVDPSLGQLSGYGLYANSAYIKGKFIVENGSNVYTKTENDGKISTAKNEAVASAKTYTDSQSTKAYNDAKTYADTEIAELRQSVNDLETEIEGAFADGIIQEAEAISIEKYINVLAREKADIDNQFTIVYGNVNLTGATKTNLNTAKTNLNTSYTSLVSAINTAIQDGKTTPTEKTAVDNAFADYKNKIGVYSTRVNEALEAIRNKGINDLNASMKAYSDAQDSAKETIIKAYADGKVDAEEARAIADAEAKLNQAKADATQKANDAITTSTNNAKAYTDAQINELGDVLSDLESTINTTFQDGIIEKAEAIAIEKYINEINVEKLQLDNQYSIVYANTNLVGTAKTNLASAKTAYNSNHTTLINSINNAIADGKTTVAEKNAVNTHFGNYRTALGTLSTRIQEAIESIRSKASSDLDTTLKAYALAQDNLKETIIKAYADGIVTEEEQRAIADAEAKLAQAKADATAKANQAKQDAINASAIDAQNKANQAQANAIASSNQFALDAVKAINIGGRNLLRDSRHKNFKLYGSASYGNIQLSDDYPTDLIRINKTSTAVTALGFQNNITDVFSITQGEELTISFDVRSENIPSLNYIYIMRNDGSNQSFGTITIPSGENFTRVSRTFTAPFTSSLAYLMLAYNGANTGWFEVKSIKIERGNKATDWSPNPDEVEDNLEIFRTQTTSKFEVLDTAIQSKVSQSDYNALNQRVGTAESTIIQHANQIQSKVSQTAFDTLNNGVNSLTGRVSSAESSITQQAGIIATKVSQSEVDVTVGNAVNNIQIGGKNYQKNITVDFTHNGVETFDIINDREIKLKFKTSNPAGTPYVFLQTIEPYTQGLDYTLSFYIKGKLDSGSGNVRISFGMRGTGSPDISQSFAQDQWIKINRQLTFSNQHSSSCKLIIFSQDWAQGVTFEIKDVKLEQGTKATDWTPAPSDIDNNINDLKSRVTNAETSITQNSDKIELRATKQEVTTAQNSAVTTSKSYTDNQISVTNSAIALKADKTITDSLNSRMNNAELKITPSAIISTVKASTEQIAKDAVDGIQLGGKNRLKFSNLGSSYFNGYSGATVTKTNNTVSVPEWGATDANRVVSSGGTNVVKVLTPIDTPYSGEIVSISGWFKNNSTTDNLLILSNQGGKTETLAPGVAKRVIFDNILGNATGSLQFQLRATASNRNIDFTWWRLQYQTGNKVTDWSPSPDDIQVGSTNLVPNSNFKFGSQKWNVHTGTTLVSVQSNIFNTAGKITIGSNNNTGIQNIGSLPELTVGEVYTLSGWFKGESDIASTRVAFGFDGTGIDNTIERTIGGTVWTYITLTKQFQTNGAVRVYGDANSIIYVSNLKLEKGSIPTDWSPSPDDIDGEISSINTTITNQQTSITQINSAIALKADKTVTDSINTRLNSAELKITPEAIKTTVRAETQQIANNAISNIKLGGTNILRDSLLKTPTMWGSTYGNLVITQNEPSNMVRYNKTVTTDGAFGYQRSSVADRFSVKQNENYILSFDIRGNINNINYVFLMRNESGQNNQRIVDLNGTPIPNISTTTFTRLEIPFIPTYSNDLSSIIIAHQAPTTFWFEITNVQVEKGNKGTDYSPNPIDVNNEIVALNTRINSAETSITQTISAIALKADKTVTDGLTTRMSNAEAKITPSAINLTVKDQTENIAQASIDKISIGGINILRNSRMLPVGQNSGATTEKLTESDGTSYYRTTLTSSGGYGYQWSNNFNGSAIRDYPMTITFGLDMRTPNANGKTFRLYMRTQVSAGAYDQVGKPVALTPEWQRHYVTLDITKAYTNLLFLYGTDGTNSGYTATTGDIVEVKNFKVERGNKGTDYSVAPEDIDSDIKDIVRIQDTRDTNENPAWYFTNYKMMNVREFKRRDVIGLGNVTSSSVYCELTTYVPWTDFSGGPVVQEATVERITYSRFGTTTAWSSWLEGESTAGSQAKANTAQTQAIAGAKTYTDNQINITNTAITLKADKTVTDGLTSRMSNAEAKITADAINLTVKAQTQQIANQATAQTFANGKMLYTDPAFVVGENGMVQYPSSVGTVMSRVNNQTDSPTKNNIAYKFLHTAMADSNRCSLVRWANQSRANAIFVTRIIAKLPVGWRIQDAHNTYGDSANRSVTWLTPTLGTGMYEEYVLKLVCGNTGSFSTINHFDLRKVDASTPTPTTANPIESYIAWATVYDMSEVYNKPDEEEIKAGISITSNSVNVFGKSLSLAGKVTFTSLDSGTQSTINTANNNASSALSTAGTANSNANTALSTANTANSNATNAKSKTDAWTYTGKTTINGGQIEANSITADKINTDNLTARQIKTSDLTSRLSINETNDNTIKIRHTNGQVAISMGLVGGVPKIVFYDSSGNKVWEGGTAGIVYVNDVPESWTTGNLFFMDSISSATETLTTTKINTFKNKIKLNSSGSVTNRQMNSGTIYYLYSEGINATSGTNKQYAGYHTNQVKSVSNFIPNGWYVFGNSTLFSDGPGSGTYSATVFKVFNGLVQDDYDVISGIS